MIKNLTFILALSICASVARADDFILSAPPAESRDQSLQLYQPIADYLSRVSGHNVVYEYPGNWPGYVKNMQQSKYDFVLDSPHFVSWRIANIEHRLLIGLAADLAYVVVALDDQVNQQLTDLKGKTACSAPVPNLDALTLLDQYESLWAQPEIMVVMGYKERLSGLLSGQCHAAVLPKRVYNKLIKNKSSTATSIIFESQDLTHYGLSVGPRVRAGMYEKLRSGLLSQVADPAFTELSNLYAVGGENGAGRVSGNLESYQGYAYLLADYWGF